TRGCHTKRMTVKVSLVILLLLLLQFQESNAFYIPDSEMFIAPFAKDTEDNARFFSEIDIDLQWVEMELEKDKTVLKQEEKEYEIDYRTGEESME
ncbi:hypothetical protein PFISCL1PPCAC_21408, partial [Pristionchus fissidentatus]